LQVLGIKLPGQSVTVREISRWETQLSVRGMISIH